LERDLAQHSRISLARLRRSYCRLFSLRCGRAADGNLGPVAPAAEERVIGVILLVFVGGAIGSVWRYSWSGWVAQRIGETLPFGTLAVNLTGSLLIGFALNYARPELHRALSQSVLAFVVVGICGGLTTFSSFILQTFHLLRQKRFWIALANILLSTILCIGMVAVGWWLATLVLG
jgi:fluoride exporter